MRDPHVQRLFYKVDGEGSVSYSNPVPLSFSSRLGHFNIDSGVLAFEPAEHFMSTNDARAALETFLKSWEIGTDLALNVGEIRFEYERAEIVDRNPPPPGTPQNLNVESASSVFIGESVSIAITRRDYPPPPQAFRSTPEVEMAYRRWRTYLEGREPLQSMAYFVLTVLLALAGNRYLTAKTYSISRAVLQTHGRLSTAGGEGNARKVKAGVPLKDLTGVEQTWLAASTKLLIRRMGEHASGAQVSQITMRDLPNLKS